jgi:hypothetical protein
MKKLFRIAVILSITAILLIPALPVSAIQNGTFDDDAHPYVCLVAFYDGDMNFLWRTTGELIAPVLVLTAGHGTYEATLASVWFDSEMDPTDSGTMPFPVTGYPDYGGGTSVTGTPYTDPDYLAVPLPGLPGYDYHDVGVVVLDEPVAITPAQLPSAGLVDTLKMNATVDLVGYGVNYQLRGGGLGPYNSWVSYRDRYFAQANYLKTKGVLSSEFLTLTANPGMGKGGTTFGDSGGPILKGGTDIILGENSFVTNYNCSGVTYAQRIDIPDILEWISTFMD